MLVRDAVTTDVVTVEADASLQRAVGRMLRAVVGILTRTDVVRSQETLVDEAHRLERGRKGWSPEDE